MIMDKKVTQDPGFYRDLINEIWSRVTEGPQRGANVSCMIGTTIKRKDETGEVFDVDVCIDYDATLSSPASKGSWDEPGYGAEWDFDITKIDLDLGHHHTASELAEAGGPLTPKEKEIVTTWFDHNHERAAEIANDQYEPDGY